jgi:hypothetical protein
MPLDEKLESLYCRTGNQMLFHFFHFRQRLPGSAARIIAQNFASCRLASSFMVSLFFVFIGSPPSLARLAWVKMGCGIKIWYHDLQYNDKEFLKNPYTRTGSKGRPSSQKVKFPVCPAYPRQAQAGNLKFRFSSLLKKRYFSGCSKMPRCKAPETLMSEAYLDVRRNEEG